MRLIEIRGNILCTEREKNYYNAGKQLTEKISLPENNINVNNVTLSEDRKTKLQAIRNRRQEGMQVRSRKKWLQAGEKASKYCLQLRKP